MTTSFASPRAGGKRKSPISRSGRDPLKKLGEATNDEQEGRAKGSQEAARRTDSGGRLRQARENGSDNMLEPERVGMALGIDAIQPGNKSDEEKARLARSKRPTTRARGR